MREKECISDWQLRTTPRIAMSDTLRPVQREQGLGGQGDASRWEIVMSPETIDAATPDGTEDKMSILHNLPESNLQHEHRSRSAPTQATREVGARASTNEKGRVPRIPPEERWIHASSDPVRRPPSTPIKNTTRKKTHRVISSSGDCPLFAPRVNRVDLGLMPVHRFHVAHLVEIPVLHEGGYRRRGQLGPITPNKPFGTIPCISKSRPVSTPCRAAWKGDDVHLVSFRSRLVHRRLQRDAKL